MTEEERARLEILADITFEEWMVSDYCLVLKAFRESPPSVQDEAMAILRGEREVRT
jgi:hypothetical protein